MDEHHRPSRHGSTRRRFRPAIGRVAAFSCVLIASAYAGAAQTGDGAGAPSEARLASYETKYYIIHSDLDIDTVREAAARLTAMAEEYHQRTKDFSGTIRAKLPFYLFSRPQDYLAAGGPPGSWGAYKSGGKSDMLMAFIPKEMGGDVWEVVQHEGFHQFADKVITGRLPIWVNEGLATYFGHGIWTGDGLVTGIVDPGRCQRVQAMIKADKVMPFAEMLSMSDQQWQSPIRMSNYDQAWSMVHFLVHADDGKYRGAFSGFIADLAARKQWKPAFAARFGRDVESFQNRYSQWWLALPENSDQELRTRATVATLTSFLGRARGEGQKFQTVEEFFDAARAGRLKISPSNWLPQSLLNRALDEAAKLKDWSIDNGRSLPQLKLALKEGPLTFVGSFTLNREGVDQVSVATERPTPPAQGVKAGTKPPTTSRRDAESR